MLDHLRKEDTLFRSERRAVREGRLEDPGTKAPSQYDENGDWVDLDFIAPKSWEPLHRLEQSRRFQAACRVFDSLSDRNRSIVRMFMIEHAGTGAIAKAFGITESAVSLIGRTYLLALKKALASH
jgi:DNA-directed RNA polymerase specialized sigma subunit